MTASRLRLHYPDGRVVVEPLTRTARANGLSTVTEALDLIAGWEAAGAVVRRPDGGYDVKRHIPRATAASASNTDVTNRAARRARARKATTDLVITDRQADRVADILDTP